MQPLPPIRELIARRAGEEMELNDRYLNPQVGRIVRTLGMDRTWVGGDRAYLIDAEGRRYLDLVGGYGVFALGRNHALFPDSSTICSRKSEFVLMSRLALPPGAAQ